MIKYIPLILVITGCSFTTGKSRHGAILLKKPETAFVVSDKKIKVKACNRLFLFIPFKIEAFNYHESFQKALNEEKASGFANAEMKETFRSNFFISNWCNTIKGNLLIPHQ